MDKLNRRRVAHNKIQQHKGKFGKYAPLEEINDRIKTELGGKS